MGIILKFESVKKRQEALTGVKAISTDSLVMAAQYPDFLSYSQDVILDELKTRLVSPEAKFIIESIKKGTAQ